jgi:urease accessory protein
MCAKHFLPNMARIMAIEHSQLLLLLNWMSPAFPIGAYAYSHGLEWAIEQGEVTTPREVEDWIKEVITRGSGWNDAVLFALSYEQEVNDLALALCSSQERYLETTQLGAAFQIAADVFRGGNHPLSPSKKLGESVDQNAPSALLGELSEGLKGDMAYPVAAAGACKAMGISSDHALLAFLQGFSNALISVSVRLVPIGQTAGLEIMRNLMPVVSATAVRASTATVAELGSITLLSDVAAMKHETQTSRIFRT